MNPVPGCTGNIGFLCSGVEDGSAKLGLCCVFWGC